MHSGRTMGTTHFRIVSVVGSTSLPGNGWTAHLFDSDDTGESPETGTKVSLRSKMRSEENSLGVGEIRMLGLDGLEEYSRVLQSGAAKGSISATAQSNRVEPRKRDDEA